MSAMVPRGFVSYPCTPSIRRASLRILVMIGLYNFLGMKEEMLAMMLCEPGSRPVNAGSQTE